MVSDRALEGEAPRNVRHDEFESTVGEVLRLGWTGHFTVCSSMLAALRDERPSTDGKRGLCRALLALVSIALDDLVAARSFARQAIHDSARPQRATPAEELRRLRLARALAVNAGYLMGDVSRARRASQVRTVMGDTDSQWLMAASVTPVWADAPAAIQRYAKFVAAVHARFSQRARFGPLTQTEAQVLALVAQGYSSAVVAARTARSVYTVRTHLRNAYAKLHAHGKLEAIARARELGLLAN
jgi:DNA-binding CsgD family transcriptional regulator